MTLEEYYADLVDLSIFMVNQINERPENIENNAVQWPRVIADVHLLYDGPYDNDMLVDAIVLIQQASNTFVNMEEITEVPEGVTIH